MSTHISPPDTTDYEAILNVRIAGFDATVGGYLQSLLAKLWVEGDMFSAKRPFGDSGWPWDLYVPLIQAGHLDGTVDEFGEPSDDFDVHAADRVIVATIAYVFGDRA